MANKKQHDDKKKEPIVPVLPGEAGFSGIASATAVADAPASGARTSAGTLLIEVPFKQTKNVVTQTIHRRLSYKNGQILRFVMDGLISDGAKLHNGKPIADTDDALAYILESLDAARSAAGAVGGG